MQTRFMFLTRSFCRCAVLALLCGGSLCNAQDATSIAAGVAQAASAAAAAQQAASAAAASASLAASAARTASAAASAAGVAQWESPSPWLLYLVPTVVFAVALVSMALIRSALEKSDKWSLADALSEEVEVTLMKPPDANGKFEPLLDANNKVQTVIEMRASTSRVIALMGLMAILLLYLGFGVFALISFGRAGTVPEHIERVIQFLLSGLTLFAPYLVNKFASIFQGLSPKK